VASLDGRENRLLFSVSSNVAYASGRLLYVRDENLVAQPFDAARAAPDGEAVVLAEHVRNDPFAGHSVFSVSDNGVLVYQTGERPVASELTWFDRSGKQLGTVGERRPYHSLRISPDGRRLATSVRDASSNLDIWIYDLARALETRFTSDRAEDYAPAWSPDGARIAFTSTRTGGGDLYLKAASGAGSEELLAHSGNQKSVTDWSPDGRYVAYTENDPRTRYDIGIVPVEGDRNPWSFLRTPAVEAGLRFSPDGKWAAYASNATGRLEICVAPFPGPGGTWQVSREGGASPRWRGDGKEIFYVSADQRLMAVHVRTGTAVEPGIPLPLFSPRFLSQLYYDVSADGQRFIVNTELPEEPSPLTLVVNWTAGLER